MALFDYMTQDGEFHEKKFPCGKAPDTITLDDGRTACLTFGKPYIAETEGWPLTCVASGVHPEQRQELSDYLTKKGVPTEVTKDGDPVYKSASHRRKALKARGMHDRNSFY